MGVDESKDLLTVCRSIRRRRSFGHPPPVETEGPPTSRTAHAVRDRLVRRYTTLWGFPLQCRQ